MAEAMYMTPKEICEVYINKGYYKEEFDYFIFARAKIRAFRHYKNPTIKSQR